MSEKFYKLTNEEVHFVKDKLNKSELIIYFHLKTLNPFCDKFTKTSTSIISQTLSIPLRTVQKAIANLKKLKLIEWNILSFEYKINKLPYAEKDTETPKNAETRIKRHQDAKKDAYTPNNTPTSSETLAITESQTSKTSSDFNRLSQTYSDCKAQMNDASETEKEREGENMFVKNEEMSAVENNELGTSANELINSEEMKNSGRGFSGGETENEIKPIINEEEKEPVINESAISQQETKPSVTPQQPTNNNNLPVCRTFKSKTSDCMENQETGNREQGTVEGNKNSPSSVVHCPSSFSECPAEFLEWKARDWASHFGYSLSTARKNLRRCLQNKPHKIKGYWHDWLEAIDSEKEKESLLVELDGKWITVSEYDRMIESRKPKDEEIPVNETVKNMIGNFLNAMKGGNPSYGV